MKRKIEMKEKKREGTRHPTLKVDVTTKGPSTGYNFGSNTLPRSQRKEMIVMAASARSAVNNQRGKKFSRKTRLFVKERRREKTSGCRSKRTCCSWIKGCAAQKAVVNLACQDAGESVYKYVIKVKNMSLAVVIAWSFLLKLIVSRQCRQ